MFLNRAMLEEILALVGLSNTTYGVCEKSCASYATYVLEDTDLRGEDMGMTFQGFLIHYAKIIPSTRLVTWSN
jgi:hypothetical protein